MNITRGSHKRDVFERLNWKSFVHAQREQGSLFRWRERATSGDKFHSGTRCNHPLGACLSYCGNYDYSWSVSFELDLRNNFSAFITRNEKCRRSGTKCLVEQKTKIFFCFRETQHNLIQAFKWFTRKSWPSAPKTTSNLYESRWSINFCRRN